MHRSAAVSGTTPAAEHLLSAGVGTISPRNPIPLSLGASGTPLLGTIRQFVVVLAMRRPPSPPAFCRDATLWRTNTLSMHKVPAFSILTGTHRSVHSFYGRTRPTPRPR